jgi:hypothetical protein
MAIEPTKGHNLIGYIPGITGNAGISAGGDDPLKEWLLKIAKIRGKQGAMSMAVEAPEELAYLYTEHHRAVIFILSGETLVVYSRSQKPQITSQIKMTLINAGVHAGTPTVWYRDPEAADSAEQTRAGSIISGLPVDPDIELPNVPSGLASEPPPPEAFESARKIVDELIGS